MIAPMNLRTYLSQQRGRVTALARHLGFSQGHVSAMALGSKPIPAEICIQVEQWSGQAVTCEELLPSVDWGYLRSTPLPPQRSTTP